MDLRLAGLLMLAHIPAMSTLSTVSRRVPLLHSTAKLGSRLAGSKIRSQVAAPELAAKVITGETGNNVTPYIANLLGRDLYATPAKSVLPPPLLERSPPAPPLSFGGVPVLSGHKTLASSS